MRKIVKGIFRPFVRKLYPLLKELANEEFEEKGINQRNYLAHLRLSAMVPDSVLLMKDIVFLNPQNNPAKIVIGEGCRIGKGAELRIFSKGGQIDVGQKTLINSNCHIYSMDRISIGSRVLISYNVSIFDNNSHPLNIEERASHWSDEKFDDKVEKKAVVIEDDVWIGCDSIILKGVHLGKGCIIAAGSVVNRSIPANTIAAGNPARVTKKIE